MPRGTQIVPGILLTAAICMSGCANSSEPAGSSPIGPAPASVASERRVEDPSGGSEESCDDPLQNCTTTFSLNTADGATLSGSFTSGEGCAVSGTGRLAGAHEAFCRFDVSGNEVGVNLRLTIPKMGGLIYVIGASIEVLTNSLAPDPECGTGSRQSVSFSGALPHLGAIDGTFSRCQPVS